MGMFSKATKLVGDFATGALNIGTDFAVGVADVVTSTVGKAKGWIIKMAMMPFTALGQGDPIGQQFAGMATGAVDTVADASSSLKKLEHNAVGSVVKGLGGGVIGTASQAFGGLLDAGWDSLGTKTPPAGPSKPADPDRSPD
jgi:hypothetical protein